MGAKAIAIYRAKRDRFFEGKAIGSKKNLLDRLKIPSTPVSHESAREEVDFAEEDSC